MILTPSVHKSLPCISGRASKTRPQCGNSLGRSDMLQQQPGAKRLRPKGPLLLVQLEQVPVERQPRSQGLEAVCAKLAKCKHDSWEQMQSEERNLAVNKWVWIVATSPMSFQVARDFFASKASGLTTGNLAASIPRSGASFLSWDLRSMFSVCLKLRRSTPLKESRALPINFIAPKLVSGRGALSGFRMLRGLSKSAWELSQGLHLTVAAGFFLFLVGSRMGKGCAPCPLPQGPPDSWRQEGPGSALS